MTIGNGNPHAIFSLWNPQFSHDVVTYGLDETNIINKNNFSIVFHYCYKHANQGSVFVYLSGAQFTLPATCRYCQNSAVDPTNSFSRIFSFLQDRKLSGSLSLEQHVHLVFANENLEIHDPNNASVSEICCEIWSEDG